jgi:methionyl-tRNA synthetase
MLLASGYELPKKFFAHGHLTVNGQKMSKTIGNVIDPKEMLEEFGSDVTKYLLLSAFPFGQDGDIEKDKFKEKYNDFFANHLGNYVNRVVTLDFKNYEGKVPAKNTEQFGEFPELLEKAWIDYHKNIKELKLDRAIKVADDLIRFGNEYIAELELWKLIKEDKEKSAGYLYNLLELLRHVVIMLKPILPETVLKIEELLNLDAGNIDSTWGVLESGKEINKPSVLFPRLEINKK